MQLLRELLGVYIAWHPQHIVQVEIWPFSQNCVVLRSSNRIHQCPKVLMIFAAGGLGFK